MRRLILMSAMMAAGLTMGCGKGRTQNPVTNVKTAAQDRDLQGSWQSECNTQLAAGALSWAKLIAAQKLSTDALEKANKAAPGSKRTEYKFNGANVTRSDVYYNGTECAGELIKFEERGTFSLNPDQRTNDGGKQIDMHLKAVFATPVGESGTLLANAISMCGTGSWNAGDNREVTGRSSSSICYGIEVPREVFNSYRIDGEVLHLGADPSGELKASDRPSRVLGVYTFKRH